MEGRTAAMEAWGGEEEEVGTHPALIIRVIQSPLRSILPSGFSSFVLLST
jgi:hypothetical protein